MPTTTPLAAVANGREIEAQAADLWTGCSFGCRYCLPVARSWSRRFSDPATDTWGLAQSSHVRKRTCETLRAVDLVTRSRQGSVPPLFLSLMSDCYPKREESEGAVREVIGQLHRRGVGVRILTKSGTRPMRDFDILGQHPDDAFGASLTLLDDEDSRRWEPAAAPPAERIEGLKEAHARGVPTWASLTPVIDPHQTFELVRRTAAFVGLFVAGALEVEGAVIGERVELPARPRFEWPSFSRKLVDLCRRLDTPVFVRRHGGNDQAMVRELRRANSQMSKENWKTLCHERRPRWETVTDDERAAELAKLAQARYRV